jgi:diguanylate cyclase (GGDEF)-like protein
VKLQNKILLLTLSLILLLGVLSIFVIKTTFTKSLMSEFTERAIFLTKYLAQESTDDVLTENRLELQLRINKFKNNNHDIDYIFILDTEGKVLVHTFQHGFPVELLHDHYSIDSKNGYSLRIFNTETGRTYEYDSDILNSNFCSVHIGFNIRDIENRVAEATKLMVAITASVLIFGGLVAMFFSVRQSKPLIALTEAAQIIGSGNMKYRVENVTKDEIGILSASFNRMADDLEKIIIDRDREIQERKIAEKKLENMAYYDHLTLIPNRANFLSHIKRLIQRAKHQSDYMFAVIFIDLDRFKIINDGLGHEIGDRLLVEIAHRLEAFIRPTDTVSHVEKHSIAARFGGDEFAVILLDVKDISSASRVADRIQAELQEPILIDKHKLYVSASMGIALSATGYVNAEDMLRDADSAMYRAKATGKSHAEIFDEEMHIRVTEALELESALRFAVEARQFMVYYQPIVSTTNCRIIGAEALIRWNHPEKGFISPKDFIPIAEETGLILEIGDWVLRTACTQSKAWQDAGYPIIPMKVNFSTYQFKDANLVELVTNVIQETSMPVQLLDVEISENIAMSDNSILILNQLTAMGLQISIDDFGTGYSSLDSLTKFPINTIKIEGSFVKKCTIDVNAQAIIKAIIVMAHSLKIEVVAEGVETEDQLVFLQSLQCDKIQGYLFSYPVPAEEFEKLLEREKNGFSIIQNHSKSVV